MEGVEDEVQDEDAMEGDPEWEQPQGFSPEYVRELLTSCVQAAVALVDKRGDEHDIEARSTRRISLMLNLMRGKWQMMLVFVCMRCADLIRCPMPGWKISFSVDLGEQVVIYYIRID